MLPVEPGLELPHCLILVESSSLLLFALGKCRILKETPPFLLGSMNESERNFLSLIPEDRQDSRFREYLVEYVMSKYERPATKRFRSWLFGLAFFGAPLVAGGMIWHEGLAATGPEVAWQILRSLVAAFSVNLSSALFGHLFLVLGLSRFSSLARPFYRLVIRLRLKRICDHESFWQAEQLYFGELFTRDLERIRSFFQGVKGELSGLLKLMPDKVGGGFGAGLSRSKEEVMLQEEIRQVKESLKHDIKELEGHLAVAEGALERLTEAKEAILADKKSLAARLKRMGRTLGLLLEAGGFFKRLPPGNPPAFDQLSVSWLNEELHYVKERQSNLMSQVIGQNLRLQERLLPDVRNLLEPR